MATIATNVSLLGTVDPLAVVLEASDTAAPMIVVSNPGSLDGSGNTVRNLMVARPAVPWVTGTRCDPPAGSAVHASHAQAQHGTAQDTFVDVQLDESEEAHLLPRQQQ